MSREQNNLLLRIENTKIEMTREELWKRRNKIIHEMRKKTLENASSFLNERAKEIERLQDGSQMCKADYLLQRRVSSITAKHFKVQFQDGVRQDINMFEGPPKSPDSPITAAEVVTVFARLNNNRACGYDSIPG